MTAIYNYYGEEKVTLEIANYSSNGNLAIQMFSCDENGYEEPFATLTVNLDIKLPEDCAFLDTNNLRDAINFVLKYNLGKFTGISRTSGFCEYPLFQFNLKEVEKYANFQDETR